MATFTINLQPFSSITESGTAVVQDNLYPKIVGTTPAFNAPPGITRIDLPQTTNSITFWYAPLYGSAPHTIKVSVSISGVSTINDTWIPAPSPIIQKLTSPGQYSISLNSNWDPTGEFWTWAVQVLDAQQQPVPIASVLFSELDFQSGVWVSKSIRLSSLLLEVLEVSAQSSSGNSFPPNWTVEYAFGSGTAGYDWRNTLPERDEILRNNYDSIRLRITTSSSQSYVSEISIKYYEEYATTNPTLTARRFTSNLYVPRLKVLLNEIYNITPFIQSLDPTNAKLIVPDTRLEEVIYKTPTLRATLDNNAALYARVVEVNKAEYVTGIEYNLRLTPLADLLAEQMDKSFVNFNGNNIQLPFSDDAGYIAYVVENSPGVGVQPWLLSSATFRPIETWLQNATPKLVRLNSDFDWYQLYAATNKNLRGKLRDIANANLFEFTSVAGHPALAPLIPQANKQLNSINATVYNITPSGTYLPEARLYVPEYRYDPTIVPKAISVQGLPTAEDTIDSSITQPIYYLSDSGVKQDFVVEVSWGSTTVDFQFTDAQGNAAVFVPGSIEKIMHHIDTIDPNPFGNPSVSITYITKGLKLPNGNIIDDVNGYKGVLGVRIEAHSPGAWTTWTFRFAGKLLYSASGQQGTDSKKKAEGKYLPEWMPSAINEMNNMAVVLPKDEEVIENPFVVDYWLDNPDLSGQVLTDEKGDRYYELAGYRLYESQASRLADALALRKVLQSTTIQLRYVGHPGLRPGEFVGIARRPASGVGYPVEAIDYFLVLDDFKVSLQAGGAVVTSMTCGYVGTYFLTNNTSIRDVSQLRWHQALSNAEEVWL